MAALQAEHFLAAQGALGDCTPQIAYAEDDQETAQVPTPRPAFTQMSFLQSLSITCQHVAIATPSVDVLYYCIDGFCLFIRQSVSKQAVGASMGTEAIALLV